MQHTNKFGINITVKENFISEKTGQLINRISLSVHDFAFGIMNKEDNKRSLFQFASKLLNEHGQINNCTWDNFAGAIIKKDFSATITEIIHIDICHGAYTDQISECLLILNKLRNFIKEIIVDEINSNEMNLVIIKNALEM